MTTVLGVQYPDKVVIVSDSLVSSSSNKYTDPRLSKVAKVGKYLIARAGEVHAIDIIGHIWKPPTPTAKDRENLYQFVITRVVPSLRKCLKDNDYEKEANGIGFSVLIALHGELFEIDDDLAVGIREEGVYGIGSGGDYAVGAYCAGATPELAVEIAARNDPNTGGQIVTTIQKKSSR